MKKKTRKYTSLIISLIILIVLINSAIILTTPMGRNFLFELTTKVVCKEQAYQDIEYYWVNEPYDYKEVYYEREPYTICAGYSWWTGRCNNWKTEYRSVKKYRTITRYRDVRKSRTILKYKEVCIKIYFWKNPDFSENWLYYSELYDRQGNKIGNI